MCIRDSMGAFIKMSFGLATYHKLKLALLLLTGIFNIYIFSSYSSYVCRAPKETINTSICTVGDAKLYSDISNSYTLFVLFIALSYFVMAFCSMLILISISVLRTKVPKLSLIHI
eukprot:TRINITY_DN25048_c0_g1_i1.p1 TRINITY_DN25048_c0_g1~~TRINITY_DN25048_c0_g1_i1.p1  ORF type:complete len:135 (-),score=12.13 TRINITY_DN25048_c0_g1_i1:58-402(-)